jgi:hypothetical protein
MIKHLSLFILITFVLAGCNKNKQVTVTEKYLIGNWNCKYTFFEVTELNDDGSAYRTKNATDVIGDRNYKYSYSIENGSLYETMNNFRHKTSFNQLRYHEEKHPMPTFPDVEKAIHQAHFNYISDDEYEVVSRFQELMKDKRIKSAMSNSRKCIRAK